MARTKQKARKGLGGTAEVRQSRGESQETAQKPWDELNKDEFLARKRAARQATKEHKRNRQAKKAARVAQQNATNAQPSQQNGDQNQDQSTVQPSGLTRKQRRKLREDERRERESALSKYTNELNAARKKGGHKIVAHDEDPEKLKGDPTFEPSDSDAGKAAKTSKDRERKDVTQSLSGEQEDQSTRRVTRSQTFTLPQRPARGATQNHQDTRMIPSIMQGPIQQQTAQNQGEASNAASSTELDKLLAPEPSAAKQKQGQKKRTPEEHRLRLERIEKRTQARQKKRDALKAAKRAEKVAAKSALASMPEGLDSQPDDVKNLARAALPPDAVEALAEEDRRRAHSEADKIRCKAQKEARKAFEIAESIRYQELKEKGSVLANWELMEGRSSFPLDFWEDLAGTKMAAMSRGVGMYL